MKKTYSGMRSRIFPFRKDQCDFFDDLDGNAGAFVRQAVDEKIEREKETDESSNTGARQDNASEKE